MKYKRFYNMGLGYCHILEEQNGIYLIYIEDNSEHFLTCNYVSNPDNSFIGSIYYRDIMSAMKDFEQRVKDCCL